MVYQMKSEIEDVVAYYYRIDQTDILRVGIVKEITIKNDNSIRYRLNNGDSIIEETVVKVYGNTNSILNNKIPF